VRRVFGEPLLHFVLLGATLYVALSLMGDPQAVQRDDQVVISSAKVEQIVTLFTRTWQRPPTREELEELVDDHVLEEVAYREGLALGLDRDDTIIRRRIAQKLDFFAADLVDRVDPAESDLVSYFEAHAEDFALEPEFTFRQVYLDPERHGGRVETVAEGLLDTLRGDPAVDPTGLGDRTLLEPVLTGVTRSEVVSRFGTTFADALETAATGTWQGPVESPYGIHLFIVDRYTEGRIPGYEEVRATVRREWENERRVTTRGEFYDELLARYDITVEWPEHLVPDVAR
jgi:hypothetical protein